MHFESLSGWQRVWDRARLTVLGGLLLVGLPGGALAQNASFPSPVAVPSCSGCSTLVYPFSDPIRAFKNRFVDSTGTRDYQQSRTLRARGSLAANGKIFMIMGSGVAAYEPGTLFLPGSGLAPGFSGPRYEGNASFPQEKWLTPNGYFYAEASNWLTSVTDGQDRLYDIDADDRGYIYAAYSTFGWGILQYGSNQFLSVSQVSDTQTVVPTTITAARAGSSYYAFVGNSSDTLAVYDVTQPSSPGRSPVIKFSIPAVQMAKATGVDGDILGGVDRYGRFFIQSASLLVRGNGPEYTSGDYQAVTSDGTNFYGAGKGIISIFSPSVPGVASSYRRSDYSLNEPFNPASIEYGAGGYLSLVGRVTGGDDVRLFKVTNGALAPILLNNYFRSFYSVAPQGYVQIPGYTGMSQALTMSEAGRTFIILSAHGLGDVYELGGGDSIRVNRVDSAGFGTINPLSKKSKGAGAYYGDPITFTAAPSNPNASAVWDLGNPESGLGNRKLGNTIVHQFSGLQSAVEIQAVRKVTAASSLDATVNESVNVQLLLPAAAIQVAGTGQLIASGAALTSIIADDSFVDVSDGSVESHYGLWTMDGVSETKAPGVPISAGLCGAHTLAFDAHYVPYGPGGPAAVPHFVQSVTGVSYTVRPFAAAFTITSPPAAPHLTFTESTRIAVGAVPGGLTFSWKLLNAAGAELLAGSGPSFTVPKSSVTSGSRVSLTATAVAAGVGSPACQAAQFLTSEATLALVAPDPIISVAGCTNVSDPCSLTARSSSNADQTQWSSYAWTIDGFAVPGATQTISPALAEGLHTAIVTASNSVGTQTSAPVSLNVLAPSKPACSGFTSAGNLAVQAGTPNGTSVGFKVFAFRYIFQECDAFSWNFGDNSAPSFEREPTHTFPANGTYVVSVTVSNSSAGSSPATVSTQVTIGTVVVPPPPADCSAPPPAQNLSLSFSGSTATCNSSGRSCTAGETVSFFAANFNGVFATCHQFSWNFGDGTTGAGQNPTHQFAAGGTYTVNWTVSNGSLSSIGRPETITVTGGSGPPPTGSCSTPPSGFIDVGWTGATSQCSVSSPTCTPGETIRLKATAFRYNIQACDTFEWDFGDGSAKGSGQSVDHIFTGGGTFTVNLLVRNVNGQVTASPVVVRFAGSGAKPLVEMEVTASAVAGQALTFKPKLASTAGITKYRWMMGDGNVYEKPSADAVIHTYKAPGKFSVVLEVTGTFGTASSAPVIMNVMPPARSRGSRR